MIEKPLPGHKKLTFIIASVFFLLSATAFLLTFYLTDKGYSQRYTDLSVAFCMATFMVAGSVIAIRLYISRCPSCQKWMFREKKTNDTELLKFECRHCETRWNSGININND